MRGRIIRYTWEITECQRSRDPLLRKVTIDGLRICLSKIENESTPQDTGDRKRYARRNLNEGVLEIKGKKTWSGVNERSVIPSQLTRTRASWNRWFQAYYAVLRKPDVGMKWELDTRYEVNHRVSNKNIRKALMVKCCGNIPAVWADLVHLNSVTKS